MKPIYTEEFDIVTDDFVLAGDASAKIKYILKMVGIDASLARRVTIAAYETEMNMIIHSSGGVMRFSISPDGIRLVCTDTEPGIQDIDKAMQEGFSTAPEHVRNMGFGAGMGLPNIKRNSDAFNITSSSEGTSLKLGFNLDISEVI